MKIDEVAKRLKGIVSDKYEWPNEVGAGYSLEFIWHHDGFLILDFLNKEKAMFWSEAQDEVMQTPFTESGEPITYQHLKDVGIPFMS